MRAYLKRFNKKMLKVKELIKPMTFEALMGGVKGKALWKELYALLNISFLKLKQSMKNHIRVEKASMLCHGPSYFSREKLLKSLIKKIIFLEKITTLEKVGRGQLENTWTTLKCISLY